MDYAVVSVPAAPVRRKPRHQSEMVNQLLFGEPVKILRTKHSIWVKIRGENDGYVGWMTQAQLLEVPKDALASVDEFVTTGMLNTITINDRKMQIPLGSSLPGFTEGVGSLNGLQYSFSGNYAKRKAENPGPAMVLQLTAQWLNAPYLWGGRTLLGVDCSGFVQVNYRMMGIEMPRDAWQQAQKGYTVKKLKDVVCGDLAFFDDKEEIVHVGIFLNPGEIIHASGKVRIDSIDKKGIINSTTGKRTHFLESIKRYWY